VADSSIETAAHRPTLLVVGAAARDIDGADPRGWRLGGTVSYGALAAARLGVNVRALVGADAQAATARELDVLRDAGVDIAIVPLANGPIFENRQMGNSREQIARGLSERIRPESLPQGWRDPDAVLLGPVADELDDSWATALPANVLVALAWQGLLRDMTVGQPVEIRPLAATALVRRADVLFVSAEDIVAGGPPLADLIHDRQSIFVTDGARGAVHVMTLGGERRARLIPPRPFRRPIDTTGAGDTFLAGYLSARLAAPALAGTHDEWRLEAVAAGLASLNVAAEGLTAVPTLRELCDALLTQRS
jgi:sugar/nucleoside kinase (ribokinase family)